MWHDKRAMNAAARVVSDTRKFDRGLTQILHDDLRLNSTTRARPDPRGPARTLSETRTDPTEFLGDPGRKKVRAGPCGSVGVRSGPCSGI